MPSKKRLELLKFDPLVIDDRRKELPFDEKTEELILSSILNCASDPFVIKTLQVIKPPYFYNPKHQIIANAILTLFYQNSPIDIVTVTDRLRAIQQLEAAGGIKEIMNLSNKLYSLNSTHFNYWFYEILSPPFFSSP